MFEKKPKSIIAGNLKSRLSYFITTVTRLLRLCVTVVYDSRIGTTFSAVFFYIHLDFLSSPRSKEFNGSKSVKSDPKKNISKPK